MNARPSIPPAPRVPSPSRGRRPVLTLLKLACLLVYAAAAGVWAGWLQFPLSIAVQALACCLLALHLLELPFVMGLLRRRRGSLALGMLQTVLFGLLHWLPLKQSAGARA